MNKFQNLWNRKWGTILVVSTLVASFLLFGAFRFAKAVPDIPSAVVQRGEFVDYVQLRGEVKAVTAVTITAPFEAGDLQILKLVANGQQVKKGDVVVEFDTTTLKQTLAQDQSTMKSADAEIQQSRAQARMKEEQDLTDVMKARYDVEAAKLDASKQEILSKIDGEEAELKLADAEQKLKEVEAKLTADKASDAADIQSKEQKRDKSLYQVQQSDRSLHVLVLKAPLDGVVTLDNNWRAASMFGNGAPFKAGDRAWPGAAIAELPDLSSLNITVRIDESERGRIQVNQPASVRIDAIPEGDFAGHVSEISTIASIDFTAGWPFPKNFSMTVTLDNQDARIRPGMSTNIRIATDRVPNAIMIPADALFHKEGQSVAYVLHGSKFDERPIEVERRSGDQLLITKGLQAGERIALQDPTVKQQ
jgi:HlyD family secretion protein